MKSLPEHIADSFVWLGLVPRIVAPSPVQPTVVQVKESKPERTSSFVTEPALYDGDEEFIAAAQPTMTLFDLNKDRDHLGNAYEVTATLYEAAADGTTYRTRRVEGRQALQEAIASAAQRWDDLKNPALNPRRMREATSATVREAEIERAANRLMEGFDDGGSPFGYSGQYGGSQGQSFAMQDRYGDGRDANAEYIPIMGGPYSKQLYLYQYLSMHAKAFEAYNHNPLAHQLVEMQTAFVLGRGIDHQCTNNDVDAVWREFCERTEFYSDLENIANDFWWQGELMMEFYDNDPEKGLTDYRMIDPSTVWEIVTDAEDIQKVFYYHQQYSTPMQQYVNNGQQISKYIIRQIPANDVLHMKLNVSKYEKRGRTDLFSVLGWLKRLKDLMNARVIKGQLEAAFVFDIEIKGGDAQVAQATMQLPDAFKPGSNWVHNANAQMKPVASGIKANESQPDVAALINLIAVGFGVPAQFLGESGKGAKAGALLATEPGTKRFEKRQRMIEKLAQAVCDRVLANAVKAGKLDLDAVLSDSRSVQRMGKMDQNLPTRSDVSDEMQEKNEDAADEAKQQQQTAQKQQLAMTKTSMAQQHELALNDQKNQHRQALASMKSNPTKTVHTITERRNTQQALPAPTPVQESNVRSLRAVGSGNAVEADKPNDNPKMTSDQKDRIAAIKESGKLAVEFVEFIFPSIAQEDRSAKLKDLALAEAMQWLPKSVSATMAAKELNITTYSFTAAWAQIVEEAELGFSMAHVYAQDNQHTPATAMAQDVQEEEQAKQPIAPQNAMVNVPIPPPVAGFKAMPGGQGGPGTPGSVPPGQQPNSGATKVNKHSGPNPNDTDPTAKPDQNSNTAKNPMTGAGAAKAREAKAMKAALYDQLLREAIGPVMALRTRLAQTILADTNAVDDLVSELQEASNE